MFLLDLIDDIRSEFKEADTLELFCCSLKDAESHTVCLQSIIPRQMLAFFLFAVADLLFNAPCIVVLAHDVSVRL